jgi:phospholipase/carboxylesterase
MPALRKQIGGLDCVVFPPSGDAPPRLCIVICHGFGAPGTDLVPLAFELFDRDEQLADQVQFVFPAAPLSLADQGMHDGRAWWPLDVTALMNAIAQGEMRILRDTQPAHLPASRARLAALIDELREQTGLDESQFVLGGFSQGAMLATDVALHMSQSPAGLLIFSGSLLCEAVWKRVAPARKGMPVLQCHGRYDSILPFAAAEWLRDMLIEAGLQVDFLEFAGDHTIPPQALQKTAALLRRLVD